MERGYTTILDDRVDGLLRDARNIATAVLLLSALFAEEHPLKTALTKSGLSLIDPLVVASGDPRPKKIQKLTDVLLRAEHLMMLLEIGYQANMISTMNASLVRAKLLAFHVDAHRYVGMLRANHQSAGRSESIEKDLEKPYLFDVNSFQKDMHIEQKKKTLKKEETPVLTENIPSTNVHAKKIDTPQAPQKQQTQAQETVVIDVDDDIASALMSHADGIHISDIAKQFPEKSRRSIQRDLRKLLEHGVVEKQGSGRYTTYVWQGA